MNKLKKHILVIAQYFYPEQFRINDICEEWVRRGYKVTVITGIPNYPQGSFYKGYGILKRTHEEYKGIDIIRIPIIPRKKNPLMLMLNYMSFVISGWIWKSFTRQKADFVFIYEVSPMTQALPGIWYAKKRKVPCYLYVTDLWPESVEFATGIKNKFIINSIQCMVDYIYRRCDYIFTSSKSFINVIKMRGIKEDKIKFWPQYAEDFYTPIKNINYNEIPIPQDGVFNIIFAGNIGFAQGLNILPEVAKILKEKKIKARFNLVGDGRARSNLIKLVERYDVMEYFQFIDKQPAHKIPELVGACDANLICLSKSKVFEITLPAKTQSCLACGKPILVSADGEVQNIIKAAGAGICANASDADMLAERLIELLKLDKFQLDKMSENALIYSENYFNKDKLLEEMDQYFN